MHPVSRIGTANIIAARRLIVPPENVMVRRAERNSVTWHRASRQPAQLDRLVAAVAVSLELHSVPVQSIPARWNLHTSAVVHVARKFGARQWRCFILPGRTEPQRLEHGRK